MADTEFFEYPIDSITDSIKSALVEKAEPLITIDFTQENYDRLFPRAIVQTPIETVKLGENQFEKLGANNRSRFLLAAYQTLATPDIVVSEDRNNTHSHNYIKSFIFDEKTKAVQDIVVSIDGQNISITAHPRDINNVVNKIKTPDQLMYAAAEVGRVIEQRTHYAQSIVNPTRADRLSTISVPLNKEYSREYALSTIKEIAEKTNPSQERNVAHEETNTQGDKSMPEKANELYVSEEQALRIQLAREIRANMPSLTDGERAAAIAILEAGAASMQMSLTDYVQNTFPEGVFGDFSRAQNAAHQQGVEINGAVSVHGFGESVRATIYASRTADFSTWCHELSHVWQAQLRGKLKDDAEAAFKVQNGNWQESIYTFADGHTDTSAEAFAYVFEDFLKHKAGEMATEDKKAIFEKFADYMSRTYNGIKQNIEMSEEIAKVYEQFVQLDDNILAEAEKAVQREIEQEQRIREIFNSPNLKTSQKVSATIGLVSDKFANLASQYGYDIKGYSHTIDNFFVSHVLKQHGDKEAEEKRGNVAITRSDICNVFSVYSHPDYIIFGTKTKTGNPAIVYVKNIGESTIFVEDVRNGKKELAAQTLYKKLGTIDVSSKKEAPELYAHSDPESISIVDVKKEFVNGIENGELIFQTAYHGSRSDFDRFNASEYGLSGEGSMFFGWGTYLTSSEDIAKDYANRQVFELNKARITDDNKDYFDIASEMERGNSFEEAKLNRLKASDKYVQQIKESIENLKKSGRSEAEKRKKIDLREKNITEALKHKEELEELYKTLTVDDVYRKLDINTRRNLYSVEIPDGKYLQWCELMPKEQAEFVGSHLKTQAQKDIFELNGLTKGTGGEHFYKTLEKMFGGQKEASQFLHSIGYTGISYPAGTIYGQGNDATNYVIFNDDDITIKEHLQFQLIGERSIMRMTQNEERERILEDLAAAKLMDEKYSNSEPSLKATRIRFATGWEKSADGQWKYELDDSLNRIKSGSLFEKILSTSPEMLEQLTKNTTLTLDDIMEAPELYSVFPFMKNVRVGFYSDPNAFRAVLTPDGIKINTKYLDGISGEKGMKGVLAHEIQHIIQAVEYSGSKGITGESIEQLYNDMMEAMKATVIKRYDYDISSLEHGLSEYMHDSGEIEARNVARRIFMNASERRHTTLESTEDIARNLQFQIIGEQGATNLDRAEEDFAKAQSYANAEQRNGAPGDSEEITKGMEQIQANGGMDGAASEADYEAEQNPAEDKTAELSSWYDTVDWEDPIEAAEAMHNGTDEQVDYVITRRTQETAAKNEVPKLKTHSVLKEKEIENLEPVTQEAFDRIVDALYQTPRPDYKNIPGIIKLPALDKELSEALGIENANFFLKPNIAHVRPQRKGSYNQDLRIEEMKSLLDFIPTCKTALVDTDERHRNFILAGLDEQDNSKANKIVFNKDELGNYIVTIGKVDSIEINEKRYAKVGVGLEPTIWRVQNERAPATMLRPSPTSANENIQQDNEFVKQKDSAFSVNQDGKIKKAGQMLPDYIQTLSRLAEDAKREEAVQPPNRQEEKKTPSKKQEKTDFIKKGAEDFLRAVQNGTAPFLSEQNNDFGKITITPQLIVNAQTGRAFKDEAQLLAQMYSSQQEMFGQIVISMSGAKEAGTYIKKCDEAQKNFVLANQNHLSDENKVISTRYFAPEAAENPNMIYADVLHKNRPAKLKAYRELAIHYENVPQGKKDAQNFMERIAWEHRKEIQRALKLPDGWEKHTEKDIQHFKEYIKNYFENVPEREKTVFQETFGISVDVKKDYGDPAFSDKTRETMEKKLDEFIVKNSLSADELNAFTKQEYDEFEKWKREQGKQNKIEAVGIKEPEVYLGRYLAACSTHSEFVTDAETIKTVRERLSMKLQQNYKIEKFDILKEIGMQAGRICNETVKQQVFSEAHSHEKKQELAMQQDKQHPPIGRGA